MKYINLDLKKIVIFIIMILLPLFSINTQQRVGDEVWFSEPFQFVSNSVKEFFFAFSFGVKDTTQLYLDLINIKKQNQNLITQNNELLSRLTQLEETQNENNRLKGLLTFKEQTKMGLLSAQVVARDIMLDHNSITINKGTNDGVKSGMAVITPQGVLGYIFKPQRTLSHILLITDRYSVVDGIVQRTRTHGIVEGRADDECQLKYLERKDSVAVGDTIVTGGLDNYFPKGFPIATVTKIEESPSSVALKIQLKPVVDPNTTEEVFIILDAKNSDLSELYLSSETTNEEKSVKNN